MNKECYMTLNKNYVVIVFDKENSVCKYSN